MRCALLISTSQKFTRFGGLQMVQLCCMDNSDEDSEQIELASRSDSGGFAKRTLRNLEHIEKAHQAGDDKVHVVTQRVLSLLGLVAYPWMKDLGESIKIQKLSEKEWPQWRISLDLPEPGKAKTETLGDLARHLRNAVAHRRVNFSSDSPMGQEVEVTFEDAPNNKPVNWQASINADDLLDFCRKFANLVINLTD